MLSVPEPIAAIPEDESPEKKSEPYFSSKNTVEEYIIGKQIGHGAYAIVRIGLHKESNCKVAMKIYRKSKLTDINRKKSVR